MPKPVLGNLTAITHCPGRSVAIGPLEHLRQAPCQCRSVYRYRVSTYLLGKSITTTAQWQPMKKLSRHCERCKKEGNGNYSPNDDAQDVGAEQVEIQCENPEDGKLYFARFVADGRDWETNHVDSWHWEMIPFKEET